MLEIFFGICFLLRFLVCVVSGVEVLLDDWLFGVLLLDLLMVFLHGVDEGRELGADEGFCDGMELGLVLVDGLGLVVGVS